MMKDELCYEPYRANHYFLLVVFNYLFSKEFIFEVIQENEISEIKFPLKITRYMVFYSQNIVGKLSTFSRFTIIVNNHHEELTL